MRTGLAARGWARDAAVTTEALRPKFELSQSQRLKPGALVQGRGLLGISATKGRVEAGRAACPRLSFVSAGEERGGNADPLFDRLAKEDMQFQRLDGVDAPLGEAHGDFLQRLLPVGAGMAAGGLLGRRLSLLRRKNSCVSETSTAASCACAGAPDGAAPECGCGDPLLDTGLREPESEFPPGPELPIPGPAEPFTTVPMPAPRGPAPPWLPSPIGEEEESLA